MKNEYINKINENKGKRSAQIELTHLDLPVVMNKMTKLAKRILVKVDKKHLEGRTYEDFTNDVILKVCDGTLNWKNSVTQNMETYLLNNVRSECVNFIRKGIRFEKNHYHTITKDMFRDEDISVYEKGEMTQGYITKADPQVPILSTSYNKKSYNNEGDKKTILK